MFGDPLGDCSVFDPVGKIVHYDKNDNDKRVFMLQYDNNLKLLGRIGRLVDVNEIVGNIVVANTPTARQTSSAGWVRRVLPNALWYYKNNKNTIFGVIWAEDIAAAGSIKPNDPEKANNPLKYNGMTI
ncbi:hypothetical protein DVR12_17630 [Chitinophaga silvatica]|uniref:Uncharacterized protein n=1 Tax=Chitinophaga silvatica TaxID=2282649 RepID=A0A3E1Y7Y4_9BACT|nr:hypothetical protein [Chitinophaga silvatica]RFS21156.1 hypothetical protein DVR12_17630 [Chitinophaga silvatica]